MEALFYDEEGQLWPPATAALAFVKDYGGKPECEYNGALVEICGVAAEYIDTTIVEGAGHSIGRSLLCRADELVPVNEYSKKVVESFTDFAPPVHAPEVYDLWAQLNRIGISVHIDSVAGWSLEERARVKQYATTVEYQSKLDPGRARPPLPPKPEVLT